LQDYDVNTLYFRDALFNRVPATFSRTSSATRVNKQGLIETVSAGIPRIDYTDGSAKLLMEPSRTNGLTYSDDFSTGWGVFNVTLNTNQIISPDGTQNADLITKISSSPSPRISKTGAYAVTGNHTFSIFVKQGTSDGFLIRMDTGNTANFQYFFSTNTFTITGANAISATSVNYGNGWIRIITTANVTSTAWIIEPVNMFYESDGETIYAWGAQLEAGSYPTSYIPTTGSAVTRNADSLVTGTLDFSNSHTWALYNVVSLNSTGNKLKIPASINNIPTNSAIADLEILGIRYRRNNINYFRNVPNEYKYIVRYDGTDISLFEGGSKFQDITTVVTDGATIFNTGVYGALIFFPTALTDSECQQLTS